ncbi:diguanylate cyclase [Xanthomonas sp. AmX2]|uniref:ligand-binding sensor domain-containing diguanylate cyclase n=1 Tax=Xanthomonas sp. TaxID=29446 RepID=UPI00197CF611|nr:ligand-binding sensor domain-containing diguanylate cyclase [Xanthomonas sp.]MBN6148971.1 diguanylate cyclase [Xanthomonas sp.]
MRRAWLRGVPALSLLLWWLAGAASAGDAGPPPLRDYAVDAWTSRDGLPHNSLRDLAQTPDGQLWFATWEGLVRYNGLDFAVIDRGTRPGLPDNGVGALYADRDGALWLSDSRGNLGRYGRDGRWRFWVQPPGWPRALIHAMAQDRHGRMWLLFEGNGLGCLWPDGRFDYQPPPPGVPLAASFPHLAIDARDRVWIGSLDGLLLRDERGQLRRAPAAFGLPPGLAWPYRAADGTLWLVAGEDIYRLQGERAVRVARIPGQGHFTAMLRDRNGELWLGTENQGLLRIGRHGVEHLPAGDLLPNGRVVSLLEDAEGSLWIGANGGLFRLRETLFTSYTRRDGLSGDYLRAVLEAPDGALWIGSAAGLDRMDGDGRIAPVALRTPGGKAPSVLSLARGADGDLWVGTYADGVYRLRDGRVRRHYGQADGLPSGHVRTIAVDAAGTVWIGTQRGLVRIDGEQASSPRVPGLPQGLITALASIDGALWIGSVEGAAALRGERVERLALEPLGGARTVFGFQGMDGDVWISTDRGLHRYRDGRLARVGLEQGMPVDALFQLVRDRQGDVWITSNRGVLRTTPAALNAAADGRGGRLQVARYNEIDGMANSQANGSSGPSAILRGDGSVWLVTAGGLSSVDPRRLQRFREHLPPPAVIENVRLDGHAFPWRQQSRLPGGQRIAVSYVGLSYLLPERIRYRTRLDGLDSGWVERGQQRSVEFIGLPPGDYTLRVAAAHADGRWSDHEARWRFSVAPLWWQRRSVQAGAALALLVALVALYRYLIARYKRRNLRLERLVEQRTGDLRLQTERLLAADTEKSRLLDELQRQADAFERQAHEDALTALPNRRHFDDALARGIARAQRSGLPLCLLVLDIDRFKQINDGHSHAVGDAVLREVGRLLAEACRAEDVPARMGGEEFAVLLADTPLAEAERVAQRMRARFHARAQWADAPTLRVTFSGGLVALAEGETADQLLQRADVALYRAKSEGRDRVCVG